MSNSQYGAMRTEAADGHLMPIYLLIAWLWVGIPLGWGVYQTVKKSLPLFQAAAPASPTVAPAKKT